MTKKFMSAYMQIAELRAWLEDIEDSVKDIRNKLSEAQGKISFIFNAFGAEKPVVSKPWGKEIILHHNTKYVVKKIVVNDNARLSYQYHERKHETMVCLSGTGILIIEDEEYPLEVGKYYIISPGTRHRIIGKSGLILIECSTPELTDVVRLDDDYGRAG